MLVNEDYKRIRSSNCFMKLQPNLNKYQHIIATSEDWFARQQSIRKSESKNFDFNKSRTPLNTN